MIETVVAASRIWRADRCCYSPLWRAIPWYRRAGALFAEVRAATPVALKQNFGKAPDTSKTRAVFEMRFLFERAACGAGTSNLRHQDGRMLPEFGRRASPVCGRSAELTGVMENGSYRVPLRSAARGLRCLRSGGVDGGGTSFVDLLHYEIEHFG
jgi:hypothetical protein